MLRILHDTKYDFIKHWKTAVGRDDRVHRARPRASWAITRRARARRSTTASSSPAARSMQLQVRAAAERRRASAPRSTRPDSPASEIATFGDADRLHGQGAARRQGATSAPDAPAIGAQIVGAAREVDPGQSLRRCERAESVGPRVGAELKTKAFTAILISFLVTLIYLAIRFEWRFGVAAVVATAHDILTTHGVPRDDAPRGVAHRRRRAPDRDRLLAERHDHHLRSRAREPEEAAQGVAVRRAQPLDQRDAAALGADARHGARRHARAADLRRRSDPAVLVDHGVRCVHRNVQLDLRRRRRSSSGSSTSGRARPARRPRAPRARSPRSGDASSATPVAHPLRRHPSSVSLEPPPRAAVRFFL